MFFIILMGSVSKAVLEKDNMQWSGTPPEEQHSYVAPGGKWVINGNYFIEIFFIDNASYVSI